MRRDELLESLNDAVSRLESVFGPPPQARPLPPTPEAAGLDGAIRAVQDGVVAYSPGLRVDHADGEAAAALGLAEEEIRGLPREGLARLLLAKAAAAVEALRRLASA